jgi:hypothetical protein
MPSVPNENNRNKEEEEIVKGNRTCNARGPWDTICTALKLGLP